MWNAQAQAKPHADCIIIVIHSFIRRLLRQQGLSNFVYDNLQIWLLLPANVAGKTSGRICLSVFICVSVCLSILFVL